MTEGGAGAADMQSGIPAKTAVDGGEVHASRAPKIVGKTLSDKFAWSTTRFLDASSLLLACILN